MARALRENREKEISTQQNVCTILGFGQNLIVVPIAQLLNIIFHTLVATMQSYCIYCEIFNRNPRE